MSDATVIVTRLGVDGDGVVDRADGDPLFIPFALPGETVAANGRGAVAFTSPDRHAPRCTAFGVCGGCSAQHMSDTLYANWKSGIVASAFRQRGLDVAIEPLVAVAAHSRRRAAFAIDTVRNVIGFHRRNATEVIAADDCAVVTPAIRAALPALLKVARAVPGFDASSRIAVADLNGGLDVAIVGAKLGASGERRAHLARLAHDCRFARLTVDGETIVESARPTLPLLTGHHIPLPPGAFFQAVAEAETAIVSRVFAAVPDRARRIADLFCGAGTLSLPLARHARVFATDSDKLGLAALDLAARSSQGLKPIETRRRDLFREPLSPKELEPFDFVAIDPPRAGAREQVAALARSKVPVIAMVSCNPATLARDARALVDGGYAISTVTPIDQFVWSAHVEVVAIFKR